MMNDANSQDGAAGTLRTSESATLGLPGQASGAPVMTPSAWAGAAMVLGAALVAYGVKRKLAWGGRVEGGTTTKRGRGTGSLSEAGIDVELVRDMRELSERLACELDAKAERLERLIEAADERVRRLEGVRSETRVVEPKPDARRAARADGYEVVHREVYELADAGLTPVEIAKKVDQPTGQVELILNLRKGTVSL